MPAVLVIVGQPQVKIVNKFLVIFSALLRYNVIGHDHTCACSYGYQRQIGDQWKVMSIFTAYQCLLHALVVITLQ